MPNARDRVAKLVWKSRLGAQYHTKDSEGAVNYVFEIADEILADLEQAVMEIVDKPRDIFLTKQKVAMGDYGDDVVRHWDTLRKIIKDDLQDFFRRGAE